MKSQAEKDQEAAEDWIDRNPVTADEPRRKKAFLAGIAYRDANPVVSDDVSDRNWLRSKGLMHPYKDEFRSSVTFQECLRIGIAHERAKLQKVRKALEIAKRDLQHLKNYENHAALAIIRIDQALAILDGKGE